MQTYALIFGLLLGGFGVAAYDSATSPNKAGAPHASGVPGKAAPSAEECCLIPANHGLYGTAP